MGKSFLLKAMIKLRGKEEMPETEGLTQIVEDIRRRITAIEQEMARMRQIQENPQGLAPHLDLLKTLHKLEPTVE
jgi:hypothetical protein